MLELNDESKSLKLIYFTSDVFTCENFKLVILVYSKAVKIRIFFFKKAFIILNVFFYHVTLYNIKNLKFSHVDTLLVR